MGSPYEEAVLSYDPSRLKDGCNLTDDGEELFFIINPAIGLWASKKKFIESKK